MPDPPVTIPARPGLRQALVAFRYPNYRRFWVGALLSNTGSWLQAVTIPFVVYGLTASASWVGVAGFLQFAPAVVAGPIGGSIADRFHRRNVLLVTQSLAALVALALWAVWVSGVRSLAVVLALVAVGGLVVGVNIPSWQAFVSELVPREVLLNAVTLNSTQFNAARAFGPALGGLVLGTLGVGWAFLLNAGSFLAVLAALAAIRVPRLARPAGPGGSLRDELRATARSVRKRPGIVACFVIVAALGALGSPVFQMLVVFAEEVFVVGDIRYGLLGAALGVGAIVTAPFVAGPGAGMRRSRLITLAVLAYGAAVVAFALAPGYAAGLAALVVVGGGYLAIASTLNTTIQIQVDEAVRGKVLAVYLMLLTAALPAGVLAQGLLVEAIGPRAAVALAGGAFLAVVGWLRWGTGLVARMDDLPGGQSSS